MNNTIYHEVLMKKINLDISVVKCRSKAINSFSLKELNSYISSDKYINIL